MNESPNSPNGIQEQPGPSTSDTAEKALTDTAEGVTNISAIFEIYKNEIEALIQLAKSKLEEIDTASAAARRAQEIVEAEIEKATQASTAAAAAKTIAEAERDKAAQASTATMAAKTLAEAERDKATQASTATTAAKTLAEAERDKATQASTAAAAAKTTAEAERDKTAEANAGAEKDRETTAAQRTETLAANQVAQGAKTAVLNAKEQAAQASEAAEAERAKAVAASEAAELARKRAESEAKQAMDAHNLSTTAGLAGAFNEKASDNKAKQIIWGLTLITALVAASLIGWDHYNDLRILVNNKPDSWALGAQLLLALFGVAAPGWLAWIATKMLSKNFSVAEDYAYKASLAKAYLGFRDQARGLDPLLEQRLFAAAVTQLDANPVRFLDSAHPGSPLQELLQQPFMQNVLLDLTVKQQLIEWLKDRFNKNLYLQPDKK